MSFDYFEINQVLKSFNGFFFSAKDNIEKGRKAKKKKKIQW